MTLTLARRRHHLDTTATTADVADPLTGRGFEVESIQAPAAKLAPFTLTPITHAEQHPDADRLRVRLAMTDKGASRCGGLRHRRHHPAFPGLAAAAR